MKKNYRWFQCITHDGDKVELFIRDYFSGQCNNIMFIGGAGFDPRSKKIAEILNIVAPNNTYCCLIKEIRPNSNAKQEKTAENNTKCLLGLFQNNKLIPIKIFSEDDAVVGSRNIVPLIKQLQMKSITDVIIDISALSIGISFPIIKYFIMIRAKWKMNLHIVVSHSPSQDASLQSIPCKSPSYIHGFQGGIGLDHFLDMPKLWLPQMSINRLESLKSIRDFVSPHDTCPIIPFPSEDPRLGDKIMNAAVNEFEQTWQVDPRDIVYAAEDDPLDLYRTILELDDLRQPVFEIMGGSILVLSPIGSKLMALGGLLAALERDLPIAYLESMGYDNILSDQTINDVDSKFFHIWLEGDIYPQDRPIWHNYNEKLMDG